MNKKTTAKYREVSELPVEIRQRCEIWTRVMGYHRPVTSFNLGKKGEFKERKYFKESCVKGII